MNGSTMEKIAFSFILDYLYPLEIRVSPMFGCHALYNHEKILLIVRDRPEHNESNGIWIATTFEHHASLEQDITCLHSVSILNDRKRETAWRMIRSTDQDFEKNALKICELIKNGDMRIGKFPKARKKKLH